MSYLALLMAGLLPPIAVLLAGARHRDAAPSVPLERQVVALGVLTALAVMTTLPWDSALIARGTWSYPHGQLLGRLCGVPVEELLFMALQPVLVGLWLRNQRPATGQATPTGPANRSARRLRGSGTAAWLALSGAGAVLARLPHGSYLGWLLAAAASLLALQWAVAGDRLWARRRMLLAGTVVPVLYLCALDRLALHLRLWQLSPDRTTGLDPLGLPVEEALFFTLTTLLVVAGLLLATDQPTLTRLHGCLPCPRRPFPAARPARVTVEAPRRAPGRPVATAPVRRAGARPPQARHPAGRATRAALR